MKQTNSVQRTALAVAEEKLLRRIVMQELREELLILGKLACISVGYSVHWMRNFQ
jgi:hypothetical protein